MYFLQFTLQQIPGSNSKIVKTKGLLKSVVRLSHYHHSTTIPPNWLQIPLLPSVRDPLVSNVHTYLQFSGNYTHWLPIETRAMFKTALLLYKFLCRGAVGYFAPFLKAI